MTVGATQGGASLDPKPAPLRTARLELLEQPSRPGQAGATVCVGLGAERGAMPAGGTHALPTRAAAGAAACCGLQPRQQRLARHPGPGADCSPQLTCPVHDNGQAAGGEVAHDLRLRHTGERAHALLCRLRTPQVGAVKALAHALPEQAARGEARRRLREACGTRGHERGTAGSGRAGLVRGLALSLQARCCKQRICCGLLQLGPRLRPAPSAPDVMPPDTAGPCSASGGTRPAHANRRQPWKGSAPPAPSVQPPCWAVVGGMRACWRARLRTNRALSCRQAHAGRFIL